MMQSTNRIERSNSGFNVPACCPFSISKIGHPPLQSSTTYLIREHDSYGEFPHIYAKLCTDKTSSKQVIVLSDTGCGTETQNKHYLENYGQPRVWNISSFLCYTINPGGQIPYLVVTTHCHYDHILGIGKLPPTSTNDESDPGISPLKRRNLTQVVSSIKGQSFVTPYSNLQKHSLSSTVGLHAPIYTVSGWADDFDEAKYMLPNGKAISTEITIIPTPGHTPDSLSWYDEHLHLLCVGDSFYVKESSETRKASWGREPPMPTMFDVESNLADWWQSLYKLSNFVIATNKDLEAAFRKETSEEDLAASDDVDDFVLLDRHGRVSDVHSYLAEPSRTKKVACKPFMKTSPVVPFPHRQFEIRLQTANHAEAQEWTYIDTAPPRVMLCAAHTTLAIDADHAITKIRELMAAILRDEVPSKKVKHGSRGEERWLWDWALADIAESKNADFSVLAPLEIVERGRKNIAEPEWR